jgi:hypothetical protein
MSLEDVARLPRRLPGTHFTCLTSTKVQILTPAAAPSRIGGRCGGGAVVRGARGVGCVCVCGLAAALAHAQLRMLTYADVC